MSTVEYINNKDFEKLIKKYLRSKKDKEVKEEITLCFYLLSDSIMKWSNFKFIDRDDALQEGVLICLDKINKFNPDRGKAFNWFTTIILNHYRQLYRTAKNDINLKKRYIERKSIGQETFTVESTFSESTEDVSYRVRRNYNKNQESWSGFRQTDDPSD